jgi:ABC-type branched-subunit amino acid transport system substrate-binding protein
MVGGPAFAAEPIPIGSIASLTGYLSDQAQNVVEGMELGIEELNAKGGALKRSLKLYARDDEMKPPVGARRFEDLVKNDGIAMHSGIVFAPVATAIQQANKQLGEKGVILLQAATNKLEQDPKNMQPYLFFIGSSLEAYGLAGGEHAARNMGKKGFILYADYAGWGWVIRDAFVQNATANGSEIVGSLAVPPGTTDYGPFLTQVLAKKPDYVACILNGMMFINCMKQAYAMGMKDKMKFMSFHGNIEEVNGCGPEVIQDVVLVTDYFWNLPNEKNKAFVEKYLKKYGSNKRPSMRHFLHYASVLLWADGVKKAGTLEPKAVSSALLGFKADYGKGEIEIRKTGDHTTVQPIVVARGKGPKEMKDKFDTQEIVKVYTGDKYFYSAKEKGW